MYVCFLILFPGVMKHEWLCVVLYSAQSKMPVMKLIMKVSLIYINTISNTLLFLPSIVPTFQTINNNTLFHADVREMSYDITKVSKILTAILPVALIASNSSS